MATIAELRQRWYDRDGVRLTRAVQSWLSGVGQRPFGVSEVDGRVDLRGISLAGTPLVIGNKDDPSAGVHWQSLDLRRAQIIEARFFGALIEDCLFDNATLLGPRLWGTQVINCSFRRTDLRAGSLGTDWHGRRTEWRGVSFDRTKMIDAAFVGCVLAECTFDHAFRRIRIEDCDVVDCVFRGPTNGLIIDCRSHRYPVSPHAFSADFSQATFNGSHIVGYRLDQVQLPEQDDLLVVRNYPSIYRRALAWLSDQIDNGASDARWHLEYALKAPGTEESDACFDLHGFHDPELERALRRAIEYAQDHE